MVEQATENRCVGGSIPPLGTTTVRLMKQKLFLVILIFFLISCEGESNLYFPTQKGVSWIYLVKITSSYTGKEDIKKLKILNVDSSKNGDFLNLSRLYSDGSYYEYKLDLKRKNILRESAYFAFQDGLVEPVKKIVYPDMEFKTAEWETKEQLFLVKGFQPPLLNVKPRSQFNMKYKIEKRYKKYRLNGKIYKDCIKIEGIGKTSFIGDTRSGPIKVDVKNNDLICKNIGLIKQTRYENTEASAFGNMKFDKELIFLKINNVISIFCNPCF